jgi:hypothetical protein
MHQSSNIDNSLIERRSILEQIGKLKDEAITLQEMEQIGHQLRQAETRALRPLLRELWQERSGELITKYAYLLDFFDTDSWLNDLIQIALKRRDLGDDGKAAILIALEGYGVDVHSPPFKGQFSGVNNPLSHGMHGAIRLGEEGIVTCLDEFLGYPPDVQKMVIVELTRSADPQGARMLEAILWHEDRTIVQAALTALGRMRDPSAAAVLRRYFADGDPDFRGEAEKNLRRLSFLGVEAAPQKPSLPFHRGYASVPDGDGYRSLLISRWVEEGTLSILYMQIHERRGLLAAWGAGSLDEEGFQAELDGFSVQDELHQVTPEYVLELLRDALYWSSDLCYLPADFYMRRGMFAGSDLTPAQYRPVFAAQPLARSMSYRMGEEIAREIFADPFFTGWFIAAQRVHEYAREYLRVESREPVLERFCAELVAPEVDLIRERLLLSADLMRRCGRDGELVGKIVALAESLADNPLPHHLHPFLRRFAIESIEVAGEAIEEGGENPLQAVEKR